MKEHRKPGSFMKTKDNYYQETPMARWHMVVPEYSGADMARGSRCSGDPVVVSSLFSILAPLRKREKCIVTVSIHDKQLST
jgi:hypothetical protein